jgi:inner membrane protein
MPSPVAHAVAGVAAFFAFVPRGPLPPGRSWTVLLGTCILLAVLPDVDFLPGLLIGDPNRYHQGASHSLFVVLLMWLGFFLPLFIHRTTLLPGFAPFTIFLCTLSAALSHPFLDFFGIGQGIPLFWPFDSVKYSSPWPVFLNITRENVSGAAFFYSLLSLHNIQAVVREIIFGLSLLLMITGIKREHKSAWLLRTAGAVIMLALIANHP